MKISDKRASIPCKYCQSLMHNSDRSHRYLWEHIIPSSARFTCSNCGQKQFFLYVKSHSKTSKDSRSNNNLKSLKKPTSLTQDVNQEELTSLRSVVTEQQAHIKKLEVKIQQLKKNSGINLEKSVGRRKDV